MIAATVTVTAAAATRPSGLFWSLARAVPPPALAMHRAASDSDPGRRTVLALHAGPPQPAQVAGGLSLSAGVPWPGWQPAWPRPRPGYGPGIRVTRKVGH